RSSSAQKSESATSTLTNPRPEGKSSISGLPEAGSPAAPPHEGEKHPATKRTVDQAPAPHTKSWAQLVSDGEFQEVVNAAKKLGEESCLQTCSSSDLSALADAARYTGQNGLSARTLLSLRRRFAGSAGPRTAFLLGRVYETQGSSSESLKWYESSLSDSPSG